MTIRVWALWGSSRKLGITLGTLWFLTTAFALVVAIIHEISSKSLYSISFPPVSQPLTVILRGRIFRGGVQDMHAHRVSLTLLYRLDTSGAYLILEFIQWLDNSCSLCMKLYSSPS